MNNRMKPFKTLLFDRTYGKHKTANDGLSTTNYAKFDKKTLDGYDHIFFNANSATLVNGEITIGYVPPMFQAGNLDSFTGITAPKKRSSSHLISCRSRFISASSSSTLAINLSFTLTSSFIIYLS